MTRVFSFLFFFISLWIGVSTLLSHLVFIFHLNYSLYYIIWISFFGLFLVIFLKPILSTRKLIKERFSTSASWPNYVKLINGLSWALPFVFIPFFQKSYPFLLLTGISLGNISTFIFLSKFSKLFSIEQIITGSILLFSLFFVLILYHGNHIDYEYMLFTSRILISVSYGIGGVIGYIKDA